MHEPPLQATVVLIKNINMAYLKNTQSSKKKKIFPPIEESFNNKSIVMSASCQVIQTITAYPGLCCIKW